MFLKALLFTGDSRYTVVNYNTINEIEQLTWIRMTINGIKIVMWITNEKDKLNIIYMDETLGRTESYIYTHIYFICMYTVIVVMEYTGYQCYSPSSPSVIMNCGKPGRLLQRMLKQFLDAYAI